jgi:hypothetical protein
VNVYINHLKYSDTYTRYVPPALPFNTLYFSHIVYLYFAWFSEKTAIISLTFRGIDYINSVIFTVETEKLTKENWMET